MSKNYERMDFSGKQFIVNKRLHSREHMLAEDLSRLMDEPKKFSAYLGIAARYHESDLRALARYVQEKKTLPQESRGRYFFASLKNLKLKEFSKNKKVKTKKRKQLHHRPRSAT